MAKSFYANFEINAKNLVPICLFLVSSVWLGVNVWTLLSKNRDCETVRRQSYNDPVNIDGRIKMIGCLISSRQFDAARTQIISGRSVATGNEQNGLSQRLDDLENDLRLASSDWRREEIVFWKKIVLANPFYADAWTSLALLWQYSGSNVLAKAAMKKSCHLGYWRDDIKETAIKANLPCESNNF